jgi:hypothetical protein
VGYFVDFEEVVLLPKGECPLKWEFISEGFF